MGKLRCAVLAKIRARRGELLLTLAAVAALSLIPTSAQAGGGGAEETDQATFIAVLLLLVVGAAYLFAHLVVDRLQGRFLVVAGMEYIVLGVFLGPAFPQVSALNDLSGVMPIIALAAGWVGLLRGMELNLRTIREAPEGSGRLAFGVELMTAIAVFVPTYFGLQFDFVHGYLGRDLTRETAGICAGFLACCAATSASTGLDVLKRRYHLEGRLIPLLRRTSRMGDVIALTLVGLLFGVYHQGHEGSPLELTPAEWGLVSVGLGGALGLLFTPFIAGNENENNRFLAMVGIITFASGAAYFLDISPLLVNLALGTVLVNTARGGTGIRTSLQRTDRPMHLVLLVFAGALWTPTPWIPTVAGLFIFLVLRLLGKVAGGLMAGWGAEHLRTDLFRGLLGHGDVTVAMAISYRLVFDGRAVETTYSIVLGSVILHHLFEPRLLRSLLVDAGALRTEVSTPLKRDSAA